MTDGNLGYDDTPTLPHFPYKVHDGTRPQPRIVTPGSESSPAQPGTPPSDAEVLFDGTNLDAWVGKDGNAPGWKVSDGMMEVVPRTGNIRTRADLGDGQYHVEWAAPIEVKGDGQGRGNSGVFLMSRYEIQVLDGYNNPTYADGITGAIYGQTPPLVNACREPGAWQSYDIIWVGPRFDGDTVTRPAAVTILHNGVLIHHDKELIGPTTHKAIDPYQPHPEAAPLMLQDHGDLVRFRNIWYRPFTDYDQAD